MKIFVTRKLPGDLTRLARKHQVIVYPHDQIISREELLRQVAKGVDGILSLLTDEIDSQVFEAAGPNLKIVANYAVGYDNVDIREAAKRGIMVTNTPGVLDDAVAEHTAALLLSLSRRIVEADEFVRRGRYQGWAPGLFLGTDITGKTLGIIGLGNIGSAVAKIGMCLGMRVVYSSRRRKQKFEKNYRGIYKNMKTLLKMADFISLHVPLTKATYHLIGRPELKLLKPSAYLINTSRGEVIDEKALVECLQKRELAGAALDVFEHEPKLTAGLVNLPNVILTPHIGSATTGVREKMTSMAVENLLKGLAGKQPPNLVHS